MSVALAACVVSALALPLAAAISRLDPDPATWGVLFYAVVIACFFGLGFAARMLAPVTEAWFTIIMGASAGGMVWALAMLLIGPPQGSMGLVALALGAVVGAWATGVFGGLGIVCGTSFLRLTRSRSSQNL